MASSSNSEIVLVETRATDGLMIVTMNRPLHGNAMCLEMYPVLTSALQQAATDRAIKAVVWTGAGAFFSTGADVAQAAKKFMEGGDADELTSSLREGPIKLTKAMISFPKLLIAAVNGPAVGFPAGLLGLCDLVLVSDKATYQTPFIHLGLVPEGASSFTIPRIAGTAMAMDLLLTNRRLNAAELVACGIASRVVASAAPAPAVAAASRSDLSSSPNITGFISAVLRIVAPALRASSAGSLLEAKRLIRAGGSGGASLAEHYRAEADALVARFGSGEPMKRFARLFAEMEGRKGAQSKL